MSIINDALKTSRISEVRDALTNAHISSPYYDNAESWLGTFWDEDTIFRKCFRRLDLTATLDFACGHGRHTAQCHYEVGSIILTDVNQSNLEFCRQRFSTSSKVKYVLCNGKDLSGIPSTTLTSLFSYNAMVHFEALDVVSYVFEFARILVPGGRALLHYSVNNSNPASDFRDAPHWRNYFSESLMHHVANRAGFQVLSAHKFSWPPGSPGREIDGLVLLEKPI